MKLLKESLKSEAIKTALKPVLKTFAGTAAAGAGFPLVPKLWKKYTGKEYAVDEPTPNEPTQEPSQPAPVATGSLGNTSSSINPNYALGAAGLAAAGGLGYLAYKKLKEKQKDVNKQTKTI